MPPLTALFASHARQARRTVAITLVDTIGVSLLFASAARLNSLTMMAYTNRPVEIPPPLATDNVPEDTDRRRDPSVTSRGGSLLPSSHADGRSPDDVIDTSTAPCLTSSAWSAS